jgi:hypothetical protein
MQYSFPLVWLSIDLSFIIQNDFSRKKTDNIDYQRNGLETHAKTAQHP